MRRLSDLSAKRESESEEPSPRPLGGQILTALNYDLFPDIEPQPRGAPRTTGTFPSQMLEALLEEGAISASKPFAEKQIQPSSFDLRLGPVAYRVQASFLPVGRMKVEGKLQKLVMDEIDLTRAALFEKGCVYLVPLLEQLRLPRDVYGKANPRSTTGRLDIFTRLITDYGMEFDRVIPGYTGKLYAEIVPRTFGVILQEGIRLNQLRLIRGRHRQGDPTLSRLNEEEPLVYNEEGLPEEPTIEGGLRLSIDLKGKRGADVVGYKAKKHAPAIDFKKVDYYDPLEFWDPVHASRIANGLVLNPGDFYIFASKERVSVPPHFAAELVPFDAAIGEFRIHYAGFFDPGFGYGGDAVKGAAAVLEVRSHDIPFLVDDGQMVGRLVFEPLIEKPDRIYGEKLGSAYQSQSLALSKQFRRGEAVMTG